MLYYHFRDNPKLGDGNCKVVMIKYTPFNFRDNPKLGDGNIQSRGKHNAYGWDFRDNPKLGDGNSLGSLI